MAITSFKTIPKHGALTERGTHIRHIEHKFKKFKRSIRIRLHTRRRSSNELQANLELNQTLSTETQTDVSDPDSQDYEFETGPEPGSEEWRTQPARIKLPPHARTPESWLVLATFMKVVLIGGRGIRLLQMIAAGSVMLLTVKYILVKKLNKKRHFVQIITAACILLLYVLTKLKG